MEGPLTFLHRSLSYIHCSERATGTEQRTHQVLPVLGPEVECDFGEVAVGETVSAGGWADEEAGKSSRRGAERSPLRKPSTRASASATFSTSALSSVSSSSRCHTAQSHALLRHLARMDRTVAALVSTDKSRLGGDGMGRRLAGGGSVTEQFHSSSRSTLPQRIKRVTLGEAKVAGDGEEGWVRGRRHAGAKEVLELLERTHLHQPVVLQPLNSEIV